MGEKDIVFTIQNGELVKSEADIKSYFKTGFIDTDAIKLEEVTAMLGGRGELDITVDTYTSRLFFKKTLYMSSEEVNEKILKKITIYPSLKSEKVSIKILGTIPFYISELKFLYR